MNLKIRKSQSAVEFVILVGFVLFFFTVFFLAIQGNMSDQLKQKKDMEIKEVALTVQDEINLALSASDGYSREFQIPANINGQEYTISLNGDMVYIRTNDGKHAMALPISNVTGDIKKSPEVNLIKKDGGRILLNP